MITATITFLVHRDSKGAIQDLLIAHKKTGFGAGKVVGPGGKVEENEEIKVSAVREMKEELGVTIRPKDLERIAKLNFSFPAKPEWDLIVYVYVADRWQGEPNGGREVDPFWASVDQIPYDRMWADDAEWLPQALAGKRVIGTFVYNDDNETLASGKVIEDRDYLWPHLKVLPYFRSLLRSVEASYYQDLDLPQPVLDVGSGDGLFADLVFDQKLDVGLDPWWEPILESQQFDAYEGLVQADGADLPFPDDYFASGLSNSVLEHIDQLDAVLAETGRVLKPGAPFLFCCPNPGYYKELSFPAFLRKLGLRRLAQAYTDWFMVMSRTIHADTPEVWRERLDRAGFALERYWHYFSPASLHMLEWGHYFGAPTLLPKKLFGRWIISPSRWNLWLTERIVRPYADTEPHPQGTYTFFIARKR